VLLNDGASGAAALRYLRMLCLNHDACRTRYLNLQRAQPREGMYDGSITIPGQRRLLDLRMFSLPLKGFECPHSAPTSTKLLRAAFCVLAFSCDFI
jgi:hypothetical protein